MESITINGVVEVIPAEVVAQGREAVAAWVKTHTISAPVAAAPNPKPARERTPEAS